MFESFAHGDPDLHRPRTCQIELHSPDRSTRENSHRSKTKCSLILTLCKQTHVSTLHKLLLHYTQMSIFLRVDRRQRFPVSPVRIARCATCANKPNQNRFLLCLKTNEYARAAQN